MGHAARAREDRAAVTHAPGTVAVLSGQLGRYTAFHQCLVALEKPAGTAVHWEAATCDITQARNRIATEFVGDWLWMIDDDHVFAPNTLMRLLRHLADDRVDAVVPLCLKRFPPLEPVIGSFTQDYQTPVKASVTDRDLGLQEIGFAGGAGLLVRRRVFEGVPPPWFAAGRVIGDALAEDVFFCRALRQAGFRLFCDFDLPIGHITPIAIWPSRAHGFELQWIFNGKDNPDLAAAVVHDYQGAAGPKRAARTRGCVAGHDAMIVDGLIDGASAIETVAAVTAAPGETVGISG